MCYHEPQKMYHMHGFTLKYSQIWLYRSLGAACRKKHWYVF